MIILHLFHTFNTNYDSESGHHYLKNPAYGWVFAFLRLYIPSLYSCFSLPCDRAVCVAGWRLCLFRSTEPAGPASTAPTDFSAHKAKNPAPYGTGFFYLMPGSSLLSHGETPHYHRRYGVSLLSSAWGQVGPPR